MTDKLPVDTPEFWRRRLRDVRRNKRGLHRSVYNVSHDIWESIQTAHRQLLAELLKPGESVLDAGCGYGALLDILPQGIQYCGIDISPDLIAMAKRNHTEAADLFAVGDMRTMPQFSGKCFDYAICRSIDGMVKEHLGNEVWQTAERELCRVAKRLLLLGYGRPEVYLLFDTDDMPTAEEVERRRRAAELLHDESRQRRKSRSGIEM